MKKKSITRKEFISKTTKCAGGLICTPLALSLFHSCNKPDLLNSIDETTMYVSECECHNAQFDQEGNVVQNPNADWDGNELPPLTQYETEINENSFTITRENVEIEIPFNDHPQIKNINGVSVTEGNDIDQLGLLLFRKSQDVIVAYSRSCTHMGCQIGSFENI